MKRIAIAICVIASLLGQDSKPKRKAPKPKQREQSFEERVQKELESLPGYLCTHECKCRAMTRQIQDDAEDACRRDNPVKGQKDKEGWRVLGECLHAIPAHCALLTRDDMHESSKEPILCGVRCKRHSCRCESDAKSCDIGVTSEPQP